jgi:hypothetical protein
LQNVLDMHNASDQLYSVQASKHQLPTCLMFNNKSASNLHTGTCMKKDTELRRCRSEGSQSSPTSAVTSMTRWIRGRASSAPETGASKRDVKSDGPQSDDLFTTNQHKSAEEVKRRWRGQQIAMQQKNAQAQRPWWSGWLRGNRCALNIAHRQK